MQKEKVRLYLLAKELNVDCKDLVDLCHRQGIEVKNQLSSIEPAQRDLLADIISKGGMKAPVSGGARPTAPAAPLPAPVAPPVVLQKPPQLTKAAAKKEKEAEKKPAKIAEPEELAPVVEAPKEPVESVTAAPVVTSNPAVVAPTAPNSPPVPSAPAAPNVLSAVRNMRMRNLDAAPRPSAGDPGLRRQRERTPLRPSFPTANPPAPLKQFPIEEKKPVAAPVPTGPKKLAEIPKELLAKGGGSPIRLEDITRQSIVKNQLGGVLPPATFDEEDDDEKGRKPGGVAGRADRHRERNERQARRKTEDVNFRGSVSNLLNSVDEEARINRERRRHKGPKGPQPRKGKVPIDLPITVRSLSEAIGMKAGELLMKLMGAGLGAGLNINSVVDPDYASTIALEKGCELEVKKKEDVEEKIIGISEKEDKPEDLQIRAPIVTIMGHVDHGKTSLLDRIRESEIAATEAGGITQVLRAWRVEHNGKPITFLDTPGHEAFTKMRARGANVTDIAVIVVAADDGVMPQTEEAISHAKAAGVKIIVAINKVDLPNANIRKTEQQLYGQGLIPDSMGGDVQFVQTSAASGKGIKELLDTISLVAEVEEWKSNPNKAAKGVCLEGNVSEGEGIFATLLVKDGTLKRGDVILCGSGYGRVRSMYDDLGRPIQEAGPSSPCRVTGLDELPNADDTFMVAHDLAEAREVAEKRKMKALDAQIQRRSPMTLENLTMSKVTELKVILKADFRGSIEAIRKELEKLAHEEVRVRILHAAVGGITESDVQLALASPADTIILGFNAVPDDRARALAEEKEIQIRQYNIIYQLAEDVRNALEGKLKPREEFIHLGRAVVRDTFKISRVGTIAGCYVTQGTIERNAKVRVIRNGVVVYPPAEKHAGLESLKRFKDDVREVREGFECGLKLANYDDIKVDDVIEAYKIEQIQRTLS